MSGNSEEKTHPPSQQKLKKAREKGQVVTSRETRRWVIPKGGRMVGKTDPEMQTPEFSDQMEHLVVNPRWNVPRSIAVKEYLPRLQANRNAASHLDVVDGAGRIGKRANIDFGRYTPATFPYRLRQKSGDDNALGEVKFIFPNPWNIYLHDTPTKGLFGESTRAFSHGCVRIARPAELANALLQGQVDQAADAGIVQEVEEFRTFVDEGVDLAALRAVDVLIDLKAGDASATVWTNDLTHDYVHENSAYST